jgi:hypothetical protein
MASSVSARAAGDLKEEAKRAVSGHVVPAFRKFKAFFTAE